MGIKTFFVLSLVAVFLNLANCQNYCNIASCGANKNQHTLCRFTTTSIGPACTKNGNLGGGLSQAEKDAILSRHNQLRQLVASGGERRGMPGPQPAATNMQNMVWDNELASIAQAWANQCTWGHDTCRNVNRFSVGQNIASSGTTGDINTVSTLNMVQGWYDEVKFFDRNDVKNFQSLYAKNGEQVGHYTQVVWANTNRLGCGVRNYNDGKYNQKYLVCNYGPTGNFIGQPVYQTR